MDGDSLFLFVGGYLRTLLETAHDSVDGVDEVLSSDGMLVVARGDQSSLVADVGYVGSRETGRLACKEVYVDAVVGLDVAQMNLEDRHTVVEVGQLHIDLTVEASGAQKGLVEYVGAVCGGENDDAAVGAESVHLGQKLIEGVLAFVVAAHVRVAAAGTANGIDLVDEDYAGRFLFGLTEQVAHTRGADTYEHLYEVRTRHREERNVGFSGYGLCQQGLTSSRRAYEQRSFRNFAAEVGISFRILEELYNLFDFGLCLRQSGHIFERDLNGAVFVENFRFRLSDAEDASGASRAVPLAAHAAHHPEPERENQNQRAERPEQSGEVAAFLELDFAAEFAFLLPLVDFFLKLVGRRDVGYDLRRLVAAALILAFVEHFPGQRVVQHGLGGVLVGGDDYFLDASRGNILLEFRIRHLFAQRVVVDIEHGYQKGNYQGVSPIHTEFYDGLFGLVRLYHAVNVSLSREDWLFWRRSRALRGYRGGVWRAEKRGQGCRHSR